VINRHQTAFAERHNIKCVQHKVSLNTFWFLLQACRYLLQAAKSGDVNTVNMLVTCTYDSCATNDQNRHTPLTHAAANGHLVAVRVLLEGGANAENTSHDQRTALHYQPGMDTWKCAVCCWIVE
jgi:LSD1 subclass zinc finger protein